MKVSSSRTHLVWRCTYDYDDYELNEHFSIVNDFISLKKLSEYISGIEQENNMLDNAFYRCRCNIKLVVRQAAVNDKKFVSLKNENLL